MNVLIDAPHCRETRAWMKGFVAGLTSLTVPEGHKGTSHFVAAC